MKEGNERGEYRGRSVKGNAGSDARVRKKEEEEEEQEEEKRNR